MPNSHKINYWEEPRGPLRPPLRRAAPELPETGQRAPVPKRRASAEASSRQAEVRR